MKVLAGGFGNRLLSRSGFPKVSLFKLSLFLPGQGTIAIT
jgi:hypothetical protein